MRADKVRDLGLDKFKAEVIEYTNARRAGESGVRSAALIVRALRAHPEWRDHAPAEVWRQVVASIVAELGNVVGGLRAGPVQHDGANGILLIVRPGGAAQAKLLIGRHVDCGGFAVDVQELSKQSQGV